MPVFAFAVIVGLLVAALRLMYDIRKSVDAVADAIVEQSTAGVTPGQLAQLDALGAKLDTKAEQLATAVAAGTPKTKEK